MPLVLPLIFLAVPLIEIALFVLIGGQIGVLATIGLVIVTALLGTFLLRRQGFAVLAQAQQAIDEGRMPIGAVADGVFLLAAGLLLLTPGFFTDAIGFLLFIPRLRAFLARQILQFLAAGRTGSTGRQGRSGPIVIEGEIVDEKPRKP